MRENGTVLKYLCGYGVLFALQILSRLQSFLLKHRIRDGIGFLRQKEVYQFMLEINDALQQRDFLTYRFLVKSQGESSLRIHILPLHCCSNENKASFVLKIHWVAFRSSSELATVDNITF